MAGKVILVTGGGGYVGARLGVMLAREKPLRLILCDIVFPSDDDDDDVDDGNVCVEKHKVDLSVDDGKLESLLVGVDVVFHVASYGMSGGAQLNKSKVQRVNVWGTKRLLAGCVAQGVSALVYVSSYNVIFNGTEIFGGDETLAYIRDDEHVDEYSRTKCIAEQLVLAADSTPTTPLTPQQTSRANKAGNSTQPPHRLRTCAVRPAAIYGEGESRHFPRIVGLVNQGLGFFAIGSKNILCDWVHGDNLCHCLLLAAKALMGDRSSTTVGGQAYFCSDGHPINNFDFLSEILSSPDTVGEKLFWFRVNTTIMYIFAMFVEWLHRWVAPLFFFEPFLTKAEVCKVGYTHYMVHGKTSKAALHLGYTPIVTHDVGVARTRAFFAGKIHAKKR
eukprot:m.146067 g.146067  ORF g.146067 m.146067 type:complete len:389 (+) comp30465_c0_seq2:165-1331(+)